MGSRYCPLKGPHAIHSSGMPSFTHFWSIVTTDRTSSDISCGCEAVKSQLFVEDIS